MLASGEAVDAMLVMRLCHMRESEEGRLRRYHFSDLGGIQRSARLVHAVAVGILVSPWLVMCIKAPKMLCGRENGTAFLLLQVQR